LISKVTDMPVDSDVKNAARQLNKLMAAVICCTVLAVIAWGHNEYLKSQDPVNRITELRRRIATAEHELAHGSVMHECRLGKCAKDFLPPMARGYDDAGTNLTEEAAEFVLPADWVVLIDPEQSYWIWIVIVLGLCGVLLMTGALLEATGRKSTNESWFQQEARKIFQSVRMADTFKQLCFYDPYADPAQEPGEGNAYRLLAVVGPDILGIKRKWAIAEEQEKGERKEGSEKEEDEFTYYEEKVEGEEEEYELVRYNKNETRFVKMDASKGGFEFTLPTMGGYVGVLIVSFCLLTMQIYFPYQLISEILGSQSHFQLVGLKKIFYYTHFPERVWLQLVPLLLMSCKFFVIVERTLRNEFNQCLWLYYKAHEGAFQFQVFGRYWSHFWITVSLLVNFYIGIVMTMYVVVQISVFDSQGGNLMNFILGIFGSFGLINFDDAIMESLPQWANWYKMHCLMAGHPQGEHPDGESVDEFFGPEGVKEAGEGYDLIRWGEESQAEGEKGAVLDFTRNKPLKTKFVNVGIQLTEARNFLGFYYSGCKITKVADDGAAAWAVDMDEVKNGVHRHIDIVVPLDPEESSARSQTGDGGDFGYGLTFEYGSLRVKDVASGLAFAHGVRSKYRLAALDGVNLVQQRLKEKQEEHLKEADYEEIKREVKEKLAAKGGLLRFHERAQIFEPAKQGDDGHQWQPIGDGARGPYLYKGKEATEAGYWEYQSEIHKKQDEADGETLPRLAWPPSTDSLHMFWHRAGEKWAYGCANPMTITKKKEAASFEKTFLVSLDRDANGLLQVKEIRGKVVDDNDGRELNFDMGMYVAAFNVTRASGLVTVWQADQDSEDNGSHHELVAKFGQVLKGEECQLVFKPMKVLRKPRATGLERGMIIHKINGETVQSGEDVSRVLRRLKGDGVSYPTMEYDADRFKDGKGKPLTGPNWTGGTLVSRDKDGKFIVDEKKEGGAVVKEFTMTLIRAADDNRTFDDVVHGVIYAAVRILLFASLVFILATYYVDSTTGHHVGI